MEPTEQQEFFRWIGTFFNQLVCHGLWHKRFSTFRFKGRQVYAVQWIVPENPSGLDFKSDESLERGQIGADRLCTFPIGPKIPYPSQDFLPIELYWVTDVGV